MNERMAEDFFEEVVRALASDLTGRQRSPALRFNEMVADGAFDDMTDVAYASCLHATNAVARLWGQDAELSTDEVIRRAFAAIDMTAVDVGAIATILARCWARARPDTHGDGYVRQPFGYLTLPSADGDAPAADGLAGMSPRDIASRISQRVWGQEDAVRDASLMLWNHARGNRRVMVLMGPTGSGKTLIADTISKLWPHVAWLDGSQVSMEGWSGSVKFTNVFQGMSRSDAERAIVIIDEADKMFEPKTTAHGENVSAQLQTELLKMMDGGHVRMTFGQDARSLGEDMSMAHVSFVLMGTFEHLLDGMAHERRSAGFAADNRAIDDALTRLPTTEDLERHAGVRREIAGRVDTIARVIPLTEDDYVRLLADPERSPAVRLSAAYGLPCELTDDDRRRMARVAVASGLGVRSLEAQVTRLLDEEAWDAAPEPAPAPAAPAPTDDASVARRREFATPWEDGAGA